MQFGIFDHLDFRNEPTARFYNDRIALIKSAEAAGFRAYHLAEHHGTPIGMAPSPGIFLAAVARETSSIRIGAMVYCLPLYIPLRLLEEICMLDHLSAGRLDVGVGKGASPFETGFYGIDPEQSTARYSEALEIIRSGLEHERLSYSGKYYQYPDVPLVVQPLQKSIPFWAAPATKESQEYAARYGMNIMSLGANERVKDLSRSYKEIWRECSGDPLRNYTHVREPMIGAYRLIFVTNDQHKIQSIARPAFEYWFDNLCRLWRENNATTGFMSIENFDKACATGMVIAGSAAKVSDELARQIEQCEYNYPVLQFAFGDMGHINEMESLRLFVEHVMPELNASCQSA